MPTEHGFLYLGETAQTNAAQYAVRVPFPTRGGACFETTRLVDSGRNANGELVGRMVGRSMDKQNMAWERISCNDWWAMHNWFEAGHFTFYCHYFSHTLGRWQTRQFYLGDIKATPAHIDSTTGRPAYYENAAFNVIDCGVL